MKRTIRWTGNLLLAIGIGLLIWQFAGTRQQEGVQKAQLEAFASLKAAAEEKQGTSEMPAPSSEPSGQAVKKEIGDMEGVLSIPQIDIQAPVVYGATAEILDKGFGTIPGMDIPGEENGSYAIAGHQSHVFGQFFNRLDELETGSRFNLETTDAKQTYEVYDMQIVDPEDVEVIGREEGKAKLSLVTCYPKNSNRHRLVVMAKRVDTYPE